jgi:hypothetical protein
MIQYILNILTTYQAGKLQIHCSVYSERTQHVLIQESVGILDMEPSCTKHVLAQYRGVCPQCENVAALQDTPPQLRLAFGLASRFYFEGIGYIRYHQEHRPTLKLQAKKVVNPSLVGVWVRDEQACEEYHRMGIPVWYLREVAQAAESKDRFIKSTEPRLYQSHPLWPLDCFRDDGIVRSEPEILKEQTLGAEGVLPGRHIVSLLRVFKQFTHLIPSR